MGDSSVILTLCVSVCDSFYRQGIILRKILLCAIPCKYLKAELYVFKLHRTKEILKQSVNNISFIPCVKQ